MSTNMSYAKQFCIAILFTAVLVAPVTVSAENATSSGTSNKTPKPTVNRDKAAEAKNRVASKAAEMRDKKEQLSSRSAQLKEDRCKIISQRIDLNVTRFETSRNEHVSNYQNAKKRTEEVIARLKKEGLNTAKLEQDLVELDRLIKQFATDYSAYITALKGSKQHPCGNSEGEFKTAVQEARTLLMKAKQSALAVRTYYQNTIRPDILAIKAQRKSSGSPKASATPTTSTTPVATSSAQ